MKQYRKQADLAARNSAWTFFKFLPVIVVVIGFMFILTGGVKVGSTLVERKIFEESYQKKESVARGLSIFEAKLLEVNLKLSRGTLAQEDRNRLLNKKAVLNVQIANLKKKRGGEINEKIFKTSPRLHSSFRAVSMFSTNGV